MNKKLEQKHRFLQKKLSSAGKGEVKREKNKENALSNAIQRKKTAKKSKKRK
ncbi:MAG: hypothetical protein ABIF01_01065 [Candidatus Micrarchaeota archaeon]